MANKGENSVGLIDGVSKEKTRGSDTMAASSSPGRIWMILALIFIATSLALAGYIIYVKAFEKPARPAMTREEIVKRFPLLFRTPDEQKSFEFKYFQQNSEANLEPATNVTDNNISFCNFDCPSYRPLRPAKRKRSFADQDSLLEWVVAYKTVHEMYKRDVAYKTMHPMYKRDVSTALGPVIYHGCCISRHYFISPDKGVTAEGVNCTLVQLDDKRQYFPSQVCKHATNCQGCGCAQETTLMTAVVTNTDYPESSDEPYVLAAIKIPGCCKCFNNLKAP